MTSEENLQSLKRAAELMALLNRRRNERFIAALVDNYAALCLLIDETQKDKDEYIDEMSLGGRTYREHR